MNIPTNVSKRDLHKYKHGLCASAEYNCWKNMLRRCTNPNHPSYKSYGGRGITVCLAWRESFAAFLGDVGLKPSDQHSLDRIDNDRGYGPGNCRWATRQQQARNGSRNHIVTVRGESMPLISACEAAGADYEKVRSKIRAGFSAEDALDTAIQSLAA